MKCLAKPYVAKQFLVNGIGSSWANSAMSGKNGKTAAAGDDETIAYTPGETSSATMDDIFSNPQIADRLNFDYGKKPVVVSISPAHIDFEDLMKMKIIDFGNKSLSGVRDDANRHKVQRQLAGERGDQNEPIILTMKDNKYKVMEGFHRLMAYFYHHCPEQIKKLIDAQEQTPWESIDLNQWPPASIQAYVGKALAA